MKRLILILPLLLITAFFAYRYFILEPKERLGDRLQHDAYQILCTIEVPISSDKTTNLDSKIKYVMLQSRLYSPIPEYVVGASLSNNYKHAVSMKFDKKCATVLNYFLLNDLFPDHVKTLFFKHNPNFEAQSNAIESSSQRCELTVTLPYEDVQGRLSEFLKLRLKSFEGTIAVNRLNTSSEQSRLSFNSTCNQVLADYLMQDLMPADYFQMTQ
ncbi:hypothetical protein AAEX37_00831 [Oligella sp. MSHR50489EDL]|uniref:hypothetical protein n=1 Tax=Oligella sp. MSHR50489EDL TaxID=3139409 RepID=UPI003D8156D1